MMVSFGGRCAKAEKPQCRLKHWGWIRDEFSGQLNPHRFTPAHRTHGGLGDVKISRPHILEVAFNFIASGDPALEQIFSYQIDGGDFERQARWQCDELRRLTGMGSGDWALCIL
jgi:hypothetical protein